MLARKVNSVSSLPRHHGFAVVDAAALPQNQFHLLLREKEEVLVAVLAERMTPYYKDTRPVTWECARLRESESNEMCVFRAL